MKSKFRKLFKNKKKDEVSSISDFFKDNNMEYKFEKNNNEKIANKLVKIDKKKINLENLKEVGLIFSAIILVGIGYINFSKNPQNNLENTLATSSNNIGDVQLVNGDAVLVENEKLASGEQIEGNIVSNDNLEEDSSEIINNNDEIVDNNENEVSDVNNENTQVNSEQVVSNKAYFTELRLNRDNLYSEKIDTYQKIIDSVSISSEQKSIAVQEIDKLTTQKNAISVAEELIKLKGFEDVVIYANGDSISVVVRIAALSLEQVAQVQNIVSRELGVEVKNINISNR